MKFFIKPILSIVFMLLATSCSRPVPPHVAIGCKIQFDKCMVLNTFKGPLEAHEICMAKRTNRCRF